MKVKLKSEEMTWPQILALIVLVVIVVLGIWRFRQALNVDAEFYDSRVAAHQQECATAREAVRWAERGQ